MLINYIKFIMSRSVANNSIKKNKYLSDNKSTNKKYRRTTYNSKNIVDIIWNKAKTIRGKDPVMYRKDPECNF